MSLGFLNTLKVMAGAALFLSSRGALAIEQRQPAYLMNLPGPPAFSANTMSEPGAREVRVTDTVQLSPLSVEIMTTDTLRQQAHELFLQALTGSKPNKGNVHEVIKYYKGAIALLKGIPGSEINDEDRLHLATYYRALGLDTQTTGLAKETQLFFMKAKAALDDIGKGSRNDYYFRVRADICYKITLTHYAKGNWEEGRVNAFHGISALREIPNDRKTREDWMQRARCLYSIGATYLNTEGRDVANAIKYLKSAITTLERDTPLALLKQDAAYWRQIMTCQSDLAVAHNINNNRVSAIESAKKAIDAFNRIPESERTNADHRALAKDWSNLAKFYFQDGHAEARAATQAAIDAFNRIPVAVRTEEDRCAIKTNEHLLGLINNPLALPRNAM